MELIAGALGLDASVGARQVWSLLVDTLRQASGQLGYRQPSVGIRDKGEVPTFVLMSEQYGIVLIDVIDDKVTRFNDELDHFVLDNGSSIYNREIVLENFKYEIESRLKKDHTVWNRRAQKLNISIRSMLIFLRNRDDAIARLRDNYDPQMEWYSGEDIERKVRTFFSSQHEQRTAPEIVDVCISLLEGTAELSKSSKQPRRIDPTSKNDFIQESLRTVFKLDQTQRKVALQIPDGPQRIRGLAGTGKTVILSLKAALAHKEFPSFKILFMFNTQSMYPQIRSMISQYYVSETREMPNWDKLRIMHAWGGKLQEGVYSYICDQYGLKPLIFSEVRASKDPLGEVYAALLRNSGALIRPEFDLILIDEAQDFASPVFEVAHLLAKEPKRIVWAYDEFQSMTDLRMPGPERLFGTRADGRPNVPNEALEGLYPGEIEKDFILPNAYRNPRRTLMAAHGIALGLYRPQGVVDIIDERRDWEALGYRLVEPAGKDRCAPGDHVVIERPEEHSRNTLEALLKQANRDPELVTFDIYESKPDELDHVASVIADTIEREGVPPEEVVVISLNSTSVKSELAYLRGKLNEKGVKSIMPGFIERSSLFKEKGFVTLTTPFRAKGNEANIVFVTSAETITPDSTFRRRNAAFVSMTRSRGWTHVSGFGEAAAAFGAELNRIGADYPCLRFVYPEQVDLERRRKILAADDNDLEKRSEEIDSLLSSYPELLVEKIKSDPALLKMILDQLGRQK